MAEEAPYPAHREADVVLRDGSTVHVRPVRAGDREALREFLSGLSRESLALRFFTAAVDLGWVVERMAAMDQRERFGLLATLGDRPVGHAVFISTADDRAEMALAVADDLQGQGLGTLLIGHLAEVAHAAGFTTFEAEVLPENRRMIDVIRESGFPVEMRAEPGAIVVRFPTSLTGAALDRFERREQTAAVAALRGFLAPRSVAVIGASRDREGIAGVLFHNLLAAGFEGPVHPVNPRADVVQSVPAFATIEDVPGPVDLGVVVVPAAAVLDVAEACGRKGVRGLVVITAGFGETGSEGLALQRELLETCRRHGMRLIGPNCMGILNTNPGVRLNATFAPAFPPAGRVGFLSQSGALGVTVIDRAAALGLGMSSFVSVGNKADISGNDLLSYWEEDPDTDLVLLYLESFGNPRKFARITRRVGRTKPIVVVKSGRSQAGARATASHTGALIAASDVTIDALFHQAGVIRTDTLSEMFDVASLLANQPVPAGRRVGIVTNAGGPAILCVDACEAEGLEVPTLPADATAALRAQLSSAAAVGNPVDMIASATPEDYRRSIEIVAAGGVDALVVIFVRPLAPREDEVAAAIREGARAIGGRIPVLCVAMSSSVGPGWLLGDSGGEDVRVPTFGFPEEAARALGHAVRYAEWRARPEGSAPDLPDVRDGDANAILATALAGGPRWLGAEEVAALLACYGIPMAEFAIAASAQEAVTAARRLGGAVALKAVVPGLVHKTEAGAVRVGLRGAKEVREATASMAERLAADGHGPEGFLVQRMVGEGVELLVGMVHDPSFGPVLACGAGGTAVELLRDVAIRITPITDLDAAEMLRSLATFPLLEGYRGSPAMDVGALEDVLLRMSALVEAHPEIAEMDLNPVMATPDGATVVDARIRVEAPAPELPVSARRRL
ncbi:MAG TPA: GNAT family N-acetyltransferase [Actinomycetota bacterium]|nr:GNAT family N-acetyltransferase [Actinomycetota bacterium]